MNKNLKFFLILFLILPCTTWCYGQYNLSKAEFKKGLTRGSYDLIELSEWVTHEFEDTLSSVFGRDASEYMVNSYISTNKWPSNFNTYEKAINKKTYEILPQYNMYAVLKMAWSGFQDVYLLYLPEAENRHMPSGFKLKKDLYLIANVKNIRCDSTQCKLMNLPHEIRPVRYGDPKDMPKVLASLDDDSIPQSQALFTSSLGEKYYPPTYDLDGFCCYTLLGQDGHRRFIGDVFAGTNYQKAIERLKNMEYGIYSSFSRDYLVWSRTSQESENGVIGYNYENKDFSPKFNVQATLKIIDNSQQEAYINNQKGYSIRFEAHRCPNPTENFWLQLAKDNKMEGIEDVQKYTHSRVLQEKFKLDKVREFYWIFFTVDSVINVQLKPFSTIHRVANQPFKNIRVTGGKTILGRGSYEFCTSPNDNNNMLKPGRSLLIYGFRDSEKTRILAEKEDSILRENEIAAQKSRYSTQEEFERKFAWAEDTTRILMKEKGYTNIEKYIFETSGECRIPVSEGTVLALSAITFNQNVQLKICTTDHTDYKSSRVYKSHGIFIQILDMQAEKEGTLLGEIQFEGTGGDKSQKTILLVARYDGKVDDIKRWKEANKNSVNTFQNTYQEEEEEEEIEIYPW